MASCKICLQERQVVQGNDSKQLARRERQREREREIRQEAEVCLTERKRELSQPFSRRTWQRDKVISANEGGEEKGKNERERTKKKEVWIRERDNGHKNSNLILV